jgi:hypothetical protein
MHHIVGTEESKGEILGCGQNFHASELGMKYLDISFLLDLQMNLP